MYSKPISKLKALPRTLGPLNHIVAFFHNRDEEYDVLLPFIRAGFKRGDKAIHVVDPKLRNEHLRRLQHGCIDVKAAEAREQLEVKVWQETYLRTGRFDQHDMTSMIEDLLLKAQSQGFPSTRLIAHAEWLLKGWADTKNFLEYEIGLNKILPHYRDPVLCVYNCKRFDAQVVMDVLRCHPAVIISGVLYQNPFFVSPDELLDEIHQTHKGRRAQSVSTEGRQIRRAISELASLAILPAEWAGREPADIAEQILLVLLHIPKTEAACICLRQPHGETIERSQGEGWPQFEEWASKMDSPPPGSEAISLERRIELTDNGRTLYVLQIPIGIEACAGWFAVGSAQPDFPDELETLVLTIAANQGIISFQNARLLHDRERVATELEFLREDVQRSGGLDELVGSSHAMQKVISEIETVAPTDSTVLITGETGTGKELVARAIHNRSRRANQPFIAVNCAALSPSLIASELFGHERGAFTGADQRRLGRFELADRGTLFLDEISELPLEVQGTLLRILQEHTIERLGGTLPVPVDVRVIAATNRDLERAIASATFRSDLYYRLHVFPMELPPLRNRKEDIPELIGHFIETRGPALGKKINRVDNATLRQLRSYDWPGNVRELQNVIERSLILCKGDTLSIEGVLSTSGAGRSRDGSLLHRLAAYEHELIGNALRDSGGKVSGHDGAAARLGVPSTTLESRIRALKINKNRFRR